jgi:gamma-glutamylcyclotransferase (GGCT)/AIG2-like uncharacterized protein YtfP
MPDKTTDALFVYGTLMRETRHPMANRLLSQSRYIGPAAIRAKLYNLGSYPGAVPSDKDRDTVRGDVIRLLRPAASFAWLDDYEGCGNGSAEPHAYKRVITPAVLSTGEKLDAWVYFYVMPVRSARRIPHGRYSRS